MKNFVSFVTVAVATLPSAAFAQDGFYAGAVAGYDHVVLSDGTDSGSKDGLVYGINAGYDATLGSVVAGVEGEVTGSTVKESETDVFTAGDTLTARAGRDFYVGARLGVAVTPATLAYVKGGYTNARLTIAYTSGTTAISASDNLDGYRIGAGVEQSFGRFAGRLEYRYSDYSEIKAGGVSTGVDAKRHQVIVSLLTKF